MIRHLSLVTCLLASSLLAQATPCHAEFNTMNYLPSWSMGGPTVAIKTTTLAPLVATRIEVFTGNKVGTSTVLIYSHDAALNQPLAVLGSGTFVESTALGWQGANLTTPVVLAPSTIIWVGWTPVGGEQVSTEGHNASTPPPGAQEYRGFIGGSWNGPFRQHQWKFRIYCNGQQPGAWRTFGSGCAGSNSQVLAIGNVGVPSIGLPYQVNLSNAVGGLPAFAALGGNNTLWLSFPLPLSLAAYGAAGCSVLVDLAVLTGTATNGSGQASQSYSVPGNAALLGASLYHQWIVIDPLANGLQVVLSNAGQAVIGS